MSRHLSSALLSLVVACAGSNAVTPPVTPPKPSPPAVASGLETVTLKGKLGDGVGYLAVPSTPGKHPAVIVIQEWWGVTDWLREDAKHFAANGDVALIVDLYRGRSTSDADEAHELMRGLSEDRGLADLEAGFAWLSSREDVDASNIAAVGWCMGGGYALTLATDQPNLKAVVVNYGHLIADPDKIRGIQASLMGNFAGADRGISVDSVRAFQSALEGAGKTVDIKIYEGKGHAFMNPGNAKGYDEAATRDAWSRIDAFLARTLR